MFVITGASGRLGALIVEELLQHVPAERVAVSVTEPDRVSDLARRGVRVRRGDFTAPATLEAAFEGAEQVLVVSAAIRGPAAAAANRLAIDAAVQAGAGRVLYTSHQAASPDSLFAAQPQHAAAEAHGAACGVAFTALRNGFYGQTIDAYLDAALETGAFSVPADGPVSWTAHGDLAAAAVAALLDPERFLGATPPLTAGAALTFADVAAELSELVGRRITHEVVDDDVWAGRLLADGMPESALGYTLGLFRASRAGEFDVVDPALSDLIGRPPMAMREQLAQMLRRRGLAVDAATLT